MSQQLVIKNRGLFTNPNELSSVPEGSLVTADNVVIDAENVIESRRGLDKTYSLSGASDRFSRFIFYQTAQIASYTGDKLAYRTSSTWNDYSGTYANPDSSSAKLRFLEAASNLYFNTAAGIYKLDAYNATPAKAGVPKALDVTATLTGASGFFSTANQIAYRVVWGIKDANNNINYSAPSGREVISNTTGGTRDVSLSITIPDGITTSHFFQIYRSAESGGASVEPSDEMQLVYENNPTSGEISAKTVTVVDSTPNSLRGASLYTNPSQEGILQSNDQPPFAKDFCLFENSVFYANTKSKHRLYLTLLSASAITVNDTITIAGTVYTAKASENAAAGQFQVYTAGTVAQNIADTTKSLIRVINKYSSNTTVYAYYLSAPNQLPGQLLIEERGLGGSSFAAIASAAGTAYNPVLPTSGTSVSSRNDTFLNQIMISKSGFPEAVPLINTRKVGSSNNAILRILPLRNSLFIFKENEGIFRITGNSAESFAVELFDSSAKLLAPDSAVVLNNQIWCLTDQGVSIITETGVSVVSRPIEDLILEAYGESLTNIKQFSFGVGYETDRKYLLWTISNSADTYPTQCFVFNTFTNAHTRWPLSMVCGIVHPTEDKLYLGDALTNKVRIERKNRNYTDYIDEGNTYTISSSSVTSIVLTDTSEIEVGDLLYQSATVYSIITAIDVLTDTVTVQDTLTWSNGSVTVYKAIECSIEYTPVVGGNPGITKHFPEISFLFKRSRFATITASFSTDISGSYDEVELSGSRVGLWGYFPWGTEAWGGQQRQLPIRTYIPLEKQRASYLKVKLVHRQGYGQFKLLGFSLPIRDIQSYKIAK